MSDDNYEAGERTQSGLFIAILGFAALASAAGLIWSYTLETRLEKSQTALVSAQQQNDKLAESLNETNAKLRVTSETLGQSVGLTQRQLEARASEFLKRQQAETARFGEGAAGRAGRSHEADRRRIERCFCRQDRCRRVKTDVAATKTELASAERPFAAGNRRSRPDQWPGSHQLKGTGYPQAQG